MFLWTFAATRSNCSKVLLYHDKLLLTTLYGPRIDTIMDRSMFYNISCYLDTDSFDKNWSWFIKHRHWNLNTYGIKILSLSTPAYARQLLKNIRIPKNRNSKALFWMYAAVVRKWLLSDFLHFGVSCRTAKRYQMCLSAQFTCVWVEFCSQPPMIVIASQF